MKGLLRILRGRVTSGYDVVRIVLGAVVLLTAGLKAHQLVTEPVAESAPCLSVLASPLYSHRGLTAPAESGLLLGWFFLSGVVVELTSVLSLPRFRVSSPLPPLAASFGGAETLRIESRPGPCPELARRFPKLRRSVSVLSGMRPRSACVPSHVGVCSLLMKGPTRCATVRGRACM